MQVSYYVGQNDYVRHKAIQLAAMGGISIGATLAAPLLVIGTSLLLFLTTSYSMKLSRYFKRCRTEISALSQSEQAQYACAVSKRQHRCSLALLCVTGALSGAITYLLVLGLFSLGAQIAN